MSDVNNIEGYNALGPYQKGRYAFLSGAVPMCPYKQSGSLGQLCMNGESRNRKQWWDGFLDAQSDWNLGGVFHEFGVPTLSEEHQQATDLLIAIVATSEPSPDPPQKKTKKPTTDKRS